MNLQKHLNTLLLLGADMDHINGSLIEHLKGTYFLLQAWNADHDLCMAGLYHALYGTSGFNNHLILPHDRHKAQSILGNKIERIVYLYCACERDFFWPQVGFESRPVFLDRFTNEKFELTVEELNQFCELTVANELEIAKDNKDFIKQYGSDLSYLFKRMRPYISLHAFQCAEEIFMVV